ncbi:ParA family protein [Prescottella equi]|uniref:Putative plasmid partitioning protein ParA n=2 Tax=Rhodococcus hoagii TaxID=43767 RepID=A0A0F6YS45_RHOHA|nr:ParA family protein [Prescottella equi]AKF16009.1 putative plasmid partitioning protein ParA [Prescottella equi]AKG90509.1 putative plasmid partitioning protein ParA [Prescottella equi]ARX59656.1 putative plasmid partitioning protein [Prescottella equi]ARX59799.1 putative plasmid partitioning protein [Prescottella equi]ARX59946.1 putative plasmid partitioning protein [Prescottella equi]
MTITAIANLKGGVGKTTVANGLAHAAAASGKSCLLVDADMQGNSTKHLTGYSAADPAPHSLADVLDRSINLPTADAIVPARREEIHVLPSGFGELQAVSDQLGSKVGGEQAFARALKQVSADYDHILIDCRPAIDLVSRSALYAADNVLIVVQPEQDALDGLDAIRQAIEDIAEFMDKVLPIAGVVVNRVDGRRGDHASTLDYLRKYADADGIALLGDPIPQLTDISKLTTVGMGFDEHPKSPAWARNLHSTFTEILEKVAS